MIGAPITNNITYKLKSVTVNNEVTWQFLIGDNNEIYDLEVVQQKLHYNFFV